MSGVVMRVLAICDPETPAGWQTRTGALPWRTAAFLPAIRVHAGDVVPDQKPARSFRPE